jgi:hypothetical protein
MFIVINYNHIHVYSRGHFFIISSRQFTIARMLLVHATGAEKRLDLNPRSQDQGPYSQCFIFFVTYEWVQQPGVLHHTKLERLAMDKYSSLLNPFLSYEENEAL